MICFAARINIHLLLAAFQRIPDHFTLNLYNFCFAGFMCAKGQHGFGVLSVPEIFGAIPLACSLTIPSFTLWFAVNS